MRIALSLAVGAVIGLAGCSREPVGATAAILTLGLATPNSDDGAVLVTISGGPVDSVEAVGYSFYLARIDGNTLRIIITGDLRSGVIARLRVPDDRQLSQYSAAINQVAMRSTYTQRDPNTYSVTLAP